MPFHLFSSPFMFWSIAQLLILLQICLGRDSNLEEYIRTKRVISYPSQKDFFRYDRKKVVETFHDTMKKIIPPFSKNEADSRSLETEASHQSELSLKAEHSNDLERAKVQKRHVIEMPKSVDDIEEDGNDVQSILDRFSLKVLAKDGDPSETSAYALPESHVDDILTGRQIALQKKVHVIRKSLPKDPQRNRRSTEPSKVSISKRASKKKKGKSSKDLKSEQYFTELKLEDEIGEKKETSDSPSSTKSPSNNHSRKRKCSEQPGTKNKHILKRKCRTEPNDSPNDGDTEAVTELKRDVNMEMDFESDFGPQANNENDFSSSTEADIEDDHSSSTTEDTDMVQEELILSLLPLLPDDDTEGDSTQDESQQPQQQNGAGNAPHFLIQCIFGALSLLGIALLIMGIYSAAIKYVNLRRDAGLKTCIQRDPVSRINSAEGLRPRKTNSNPKDVNVLLNTFLEVLEKNPVPPCESLNQKYRSHAHFKAMKRITRRTIKITVKQSLSQARVSK